MTGPSIEASVGPMLVIDRNFLGRRHGGEPRQGTTRRGERGPHSRGIKSSYRGGQEKREDRNSKISTPVNEIVEIRKEGERQN